MSIDKDYRVLIHLGDMLITTYNLHTEFENGEFVGVSSSHTDSESFNNPIEDEDIDAILEAGTAHGKEAINGYTVEWFLLN